MKSILFYLFIFIVFALITFFGLGPVLFADGSANERMITLLVVLFLYALLVGSVVYFVKKTKGNK